MELTDVLITGIFGIAVAIITWILAGLREIGISKREEKKFKVEKVEKLYADTISNLELALRNTTNGSSTEQLEKEMSLNNGMLRLLASDQVNNQLEETSIAIYSWSTLTKKGAPKSIGGDIAMITSQDSKYAEQARDLYPKVNNSIVKLIEEMKTHLSSIQV